jgi:hypothetical protein
MLIFLFCLLLENMDYTYHALLWMLLRQDLALQKEWCIYCITMACQACGIKQNCGIIMALTLLWSVSPSLCRISHVQRGYAVAEPGTGPSPKSGFRTSSVWALSLDPFGWICLCQGLSKAGFGWRESLRISRLGQISVKSFRPRVTFQTVVFPFSCSEDLRIVFSFENQIGLFLVAR